MRKFLITYLFLLDVFSNSDAIGCKYAENEYALYFIDSQYVMEDNVLSGAILNVTGGLYLCFYRSICMLLECKSMFVQGFNGVIWRLKS